MEQKPFTILILLALFSSALFSIITPMAKELTEALNLSSQEQVAYINSIFLMVGAFSSLVWAVLADKFSRKKLLIIATLEWSIFTLLTIFSYDYYSFLLFQILTGIGFGSALPLTYSLTVDLFESFQRGSKFGTLSAIYVLGNGVGQMLSGFLIDYYTWQIPLLIISISGFLCTFLLLSMVEPKKGEKDLKFQGPDEAAFEIDYKIKMEDLKQIWKIKSTLLILIFNFVLFVAVGAVSSFLISMFKNDFLLSSTIATILLILIFGSQIPSGIFFGKLGDKIYQREENGRIKILLFCVILGSIIYIFAYSAVLINREISTIIFFIIMFFTGAFMFGATDPLSQATLGEINPPQIRSTIYSLNYLGTTFGRSISLLFLGSFFTSFNKQYIPGYLILSFLALLSSLIVIPILKFLPQDLERIKNKKL